jgi:hypothetical protein
MSSLVRAPYSFLGKNGDYPVEMNFGIRVYNTKGEKFPAIGEIAATLKGGLRTNHLGIVPLLDGEKKNIGMAEVIGIIAAKPENMNLVCIKDCGIQSIEEAVEYVRREHGEEFQRDGVLTVYYYRIVELTK